MAMAYARNSRRKHDGALLCTLCVDTRPREDNDWCPVTGSIVCEDCCRGLMMGDERVVLAAAELTGREPEPEDVLSVCTECPRLIRIVTEESVEDGTEVRLPMH
jgi:hypothetical protein